MYPEKFEKSTTVPLFIADAFTNEAFCGNSAGICLLSFDQVIPNAIRQKIALEMNRPETAFVKTMYKADSFQNGTHFTLQWHTPACEVSLCGHATLATASVLFSECGNKADVLSFDTLSGTLTAKRLPDNRIEINLPAYQSSPVPDKFEKIVKAVVGDLPVNEVVISESKMLLIRLDDCVSRKEFEKIRVNDADLLREDVDLIGVIVTLRGDEKTCTDKDGNIYDFVSRYFAPWVGINEDSVTGSAHSVLAPFWSKILKKNTFYARQCSARGGELHIELQTDRVLISGDVVVTVKGQLFY